MMKGAALMAALLLLVPVFVNLTQAETGAVRGHLPVGNYRACSVVYENTRLSGPAELYILGGRNETAVTDQVLEVDLKSGSARKAQWKLPGPRMSAALARVGDTAYIFGGSDGPNELDSILGWNLSTVTVNTLQVWLPSPRIGLSAVVHGGYIYILGGHSAGVKITGILRFDPSTSRLERMNGTLPSGRAGMAAASFPDGIYLFGGKLDTSDSDQVLRYDPIADRVEVLPGKLPYTVYHAPGIKVGEKVFIIGGTAAGGVLCTGPNCPVNPVSKVTDTIIEFDHATGKSKLSAQRLPSARERTVAVFHGGKITVAGGQAGVSALDELVVFDLGGKPAPERFGPLTLALPVTLMAGLVTVVIWAGKRR